MFSADLGGYTPSLPAATDPPFQKVALLLHGDGTNGAQNNTFLDSSTNNFTITRTGNVAQGTFSPFSLADGQWSNYFDGSGDYLSVADSTALTLTADFTLELWFYQTATATNYNTLVSKWDGGQEFFLCTETSNVIRFGWGAYNANAISNPLMLTGTNAFSLNQWNHLAIVRNSNTFTMYVNGTSVATASFSTGASDTTSLLYIGAYNTANYFFPGYISNSRIVKGTAVYTANFTPPTSALTAITNTSLLTCQSNRFVDNSSNNFTITRNGDTKVTAFSPFAPSAAYSASTNGGSAYFDGSGDYLSAADNANLRFGTSAFTIQAWVYRNAAGTAHSIVSKGGASTGFTLGITSTNILRFTDTTTNIDTTTTIPAGTWTHVAAVRTGTSTNGFQLYINGVSSKTATVSTNFNQTDTLYVGADRSAANVMNGYITDLRYVNGTAETITVPTAPLTAVTNTQLLLNCTNAGIYDNAGKNDIETVGNAQISTSVKKYGTGSMAFDGTGDWLECKSTSDLYNFGTGNFTVEFWVNPSTLGTGYNSVFAFTPTHVNFALYIINASHILELWINGSAYTSTATISTSSWTHIAISRSGTSLKTFINGVQAISATNSANITGNTGIRVGEDINLNPPLNGYIDDLRITKGQALYTANFTPPTQAFPNV